VYRTGQRFGVAYLIEVLSGLESERVLQNGHHNLSTFGIGRDLDKSQWQSVFRQLVARAYLGVDHNSFGGLYLTARARPVLKGDENIRLREDVQEVSSKGVRQRQSDQAMLPEDRRLFEALRACRKQLAEQFDVPPYVIFHDVTLLELVQLRPLNSQQMLSVNGVGQGKLTKYGQAFLRIINEHELDLV
jgi:ATP-dependent DNA helicase RecQ